MIKDLDKRINRAMGRVRQAFRAVLSSTKSTTGVQLSTGEALAGEQLRDNELFQHYGFTSNPLPGTEAVVLPMGGKTSHGIIVATENSSYRLKELMPGEVAIYTDEGSKVVLKRGRIIEVECDIFKINCKSYEVNASESSQFNTPLLATSQKLLAEGFIQGNAGINVSGGNGAQVDGGIKATGLIQSDSDVLSGDISLNSHKHNGDSGGQTSVPLS